MWALGDDERRCDKPAMSTVRLAPVDDVVGLRMLPGIVGVGDHLLERLLANKRCHEDGRTLDTANLELRMTSAASTSISAEGCVTVKSFPPVSPRIRGKSL